MTLDDLQRTLANDLPPADLRLEVLALWHDARGDWSAAHHIVQDLDSRDAAWVHAYLHRKEGDVGNARYWYARARRTEYTGPLAAEWTQITSALLDQPAPGQDA